MNIKDYTWVYISRGKHSKSVKIKIIKGISCHVIVRIYQNVVTKTRFVCQTPAPIEETLFFPTVLLKTQDRMIPTPKPIWKINFLKQMKNQQWSTFGKGMND